MARVKCLMMQRDETVLLEPWLRYYGYLFGYENLVVFDNGSTEAAVRETLARHARAGVSVVTGFDDLAAFHSKGQIIGGAIRHLDGIGGYDFALPVDCDEFIVALTEDGLSCRRDAVHACFDALLGRNHAFGIELSFYNLPGRTGWFFPNGNRKGFLPAGSIAELDHGFHRPVSRHDPGSVEAPLAYLHFHNRPFEDMRRHAARKLHTLVDVGDLDALRGFQGPGHHLAQYFFMDERHYRTRYDNAVTVAVPEFVQLMAALGIADTALDGPAIFPAQLGDRLGLSLPARDEAVIGMGSFDGIAYLNRSGDVRAAGMPPLYHYLLFGRGEGRQPVLVDHAPGAATPAPTTAPTDPSDAPRPLEPRYSLVAPAGQPPAGAEILDPALGAPSSPPPEPEPVPEHTATADAAPGDTATGDAATGDTATGWAFRRFDGMVGEDIHTGDW